MKLRINVKITEKTTITKSRAFQGLIMYDDEPFIINPKAMIFETASKQKIDVNTASIILNAFVICPFGLFNGLSSARATVEKVIITNMNGSNSL